MFVYPITLASLSLLPGLQAGEAEEPGAQPIPVILDTDIGGDIDDTWALAFLLASPEVDLKLVVTDSHNTVGKAKIVAKFLERVGRPDIPVGIGYKGDDHTGPQEPWGKDYDLTSYPGTVYEDGIGALIDRIMAAEDGITLLSIGPVPNLARALEREPRIAEKTRLVSMAGSLEKAYGGQPGRCPEYNVRDDVPAAQKVFSAPWKEVLLAPLDTAGVVQLTGDRYRQVRDAENPLAQALLENYRVWSQDPAAPDKASSILFDTVAAYLVFSTAWVEMRDVRMKVTDEGETVPDPDGQLVRAAMEWTDREAFYGLLAERLSRGVVESKTR